MKSPKDVFSDLNVSIAKSQSCKYPIKGPFHPSVQYPECPIQGIESDNFVYETVRESMRLLGMDSAHFGTAEWNPLGEIIKPGETVVLKPNFVLSRHNNGGDLFSIITHGSVLRAIADYVFIALSGKGKIVIADAPQMDCDFQELLEKTQLNSLTEVFKEQLAFPLEIVDLRDFWLDTKNKPSAAYSSNRRPLPGDPAGNVLIKLGKKSLFFGQKNDKNYYGADYNRAETIRHHQGETQEYLVSKTILNADVVISIPKLKVHKKVGVTLNIKGLVGINVNKNYLIHYTLGTPATGGDQFPDGLLNPKEARFIKWQRWAFDRFLSRKNLVGDALYGFGRFFGKRMLRILGGQNPSKDKKMLDAGNWHGNDSAWRMSIDLLRVILYADAEGILHKEPVRKVFSFIDGIVGGENDGPLLPDQKASNVIIAGSNLCAVDITACTLMNFNYLKIQALRYAAHNVNLFGVRPDLIEIASNLLNCKKIKLPEYFHDHLDFMPHPGWINHIEITH